MHDVSMAFSIPIDVLLFPYCFELHFNLLIYFYNHMICFDNNIDPVIRLATFTFTSCALLETQNLSDIKNIATSTVFI